MSRSYKKTPRTGDKKDKFFKKYYNRQFRRKNLILNLQNKAYKKYGNGYDICDYDDVNTSFNEFWKKRVKRWHEFYYKYESYPERQKVYQEWFQIYKRK